MHEETDRGPAARPAARVPAAFATAWILLAAVAVSSAWLARDVSALEARTREHHALTRTLPAEDFVHDAANLVSGRVLARSGAPLAGARVRVFDAPALLELACSGEAGVWPAATAQAATTTDEQGRYSFLGLAYGAKLLLFEAAGHESHALVGLSLCDGYGADGQDAILAPAQALQVQVRAAEGGASVADLAVSACPRAFGLPLWSGRTDAEGRVVVPGEWFVDGVPPRLLIGDPPELATPPAPEETGAEPQAGPWSVALAPRKSLRVELEGVSGERVRIRHWPAQARHLGVRVRELAARDGALELPGVPCAELELEVEVDGRFAWWAGKYEGQVLRLSPRAHADVPPLPARPEWTELAWTPRPPRALRADLGDPWPWLEARDPLARALAPRVVGDVLHLELPEPGGWLLVKDSAGHRRELQLPPAMAADAYVKLEVRSFRPFQAVHVEGPAGHAAWGWSDALGNAVFDVPPGPQIVRTTFEDGPWSWPRGAWCDAHGGSVRIGLGDRPRGKGGVCFGFVRDDEGLPAAKAEVFLQPWGSIPRRGETDEHGFYSFTDLTARGYAAVARRDGDFKAVRYPQSFEIAADRARARAGRRVDFTLHAGSIESELGADWAGADVELVDAVGRVVWTETADPNGRVEITNVPEGDYVLRRAGDPQSAIAAQATRQVHEHDHAHTHAHVEAGP